MSRIAGRSPEEAVGVLWRRLDRPGHESAILFQREGSWHLHGMAVFLHERSPCTLDYRIVCDSDWRTRSADVTGWVGGDQIRIGVCVEPGGWTIQGAPVSEVTECTDIDLNFSPSTNLLPIRRLKLAIGEEKTVVAAWLRFPSFRIEPLEQSYRRLSKGSYRYRSAGGRFETDLEVDRHGFVTLYPGFWRVENGD